MKKVLIASITAAGVLASGSAFAEGGTADDPFFGVNNTTAIEVGSASTFDGLSNVVPTGAKANKLHVKQEIENLGFNGE